MLFLALLVLAGCGSDGDDTTATGEETTTSSSTLSTVTTTTTPPTTTTEPRQSDNDAPTVDPAAVVDPANQALGRTRAGTANFDGRATNQFYADGTTLTIVLPGLIGPIEESECFVAFEADTVATPSAIEITIYRLAPAEPATNEVDCAGEDELQSELVVQLPEPLDGRPLVRVPDRVEIPVSDFANRRNPTMIPAGWEPGLPPVVNFETTQQFGPVTVTTSSAHTRNQDRIEGLANNPNSEVRSVGNGVETVLIPRPNGTQRVSFVIDDWFYDIEANAGTSTDDLISFADSFEVSDPTALLIERWESGESVPLNRSGNQLTFYTRGNELLAGFPSLDLTIPIANPCSIQFDPTITETDSVVSVVIGSRLADAPDGCRRDPFIALPLPLATPLGPRTLQYNGETVSTTGVFARRSPTFVPAGWQVGPGSTTELRGGTLDFGQALVSIAPASDETNIEVFRSQPHDVVDVLGTGDGVLLSEGGTRLVFEEFGWVYDIETQPGVDALVLLEFARSFQ